MPRLPQLRPMVMALALTAMAWPVCGQSLTGRVVDARTGSPIDGVHLMLVLQEGGDVMETLSDTMGRFVLTATEPGIYRLRAEQFGYANLRTDMFELAVGDSYDIEVRLDVQAVPLDPVTVRTSPRRAGSLQGFYDRMEQGRRTGHGHFIDREELERHGGQTTDLLRRVPGMRVTPDQIGSPPVVRMRGQGMGCEPAIYLDGVRVQVPRSSGLDSYVSPTDIEGIEVYRGMSTAPPRYMSGGEACGVILIWTRPGEQGKATLSWTTSLILGGLLLGLIIALP